MRYVGSSQITEKTGWCTLNICNKSLRAVALALVLSGVVPAWAVGAVGVEFRSEGEALHLQLELPVGTLQNGLQMQHSKEVILMLKDVDIRALMADLGKLSAHPLVKNVDALVSRQGITPLRIEFSRPVKVLDQSLASLPNKRSRLEVVFAPDSRPVLPPKPALEELSLVNREGRADLRLIGSATLEAEMSFDADDRQIVLELAGVDRQELNKIIRRTDLRKNALIKSLSAVADGSTGSRLIIALASGTDVVAGQGVASNGTGEILISLVPDAAPQKGPLTLSPLQFAESDSAVSIFTDNPDSQALSAFTLDNPPRLIVDVLGVTPAEVEGKLPRLSGSRMLRAVRVEETRLGSARIVFDLQKPQALLASGLQTQGTRWIVSLNGKGFAPGSQQLAPLGALSTEPVSLELRQRQDAQDLAKPKMLIKPVILDSRAVKPREAKPAIGQSDLQSLFGQALERDPKYLAAKADFRISAEATPQARAALLPTASFEVSRSTVHQVITVAPNPAFPKGSTTYPSTSWSVNITQPVLKVPALYKLDQAAISIEQARLNVVAAEQDLLLRVSAAYLALLASLDTMELASAEREATQKQFELAKSRLDSGLGTISQVHDTEARFSLSRARELDSRSRLQDARSALKEIVGRDVAALQPFKGHFDASLPQPANVESWVDASLEQNIALQSRKLAEQIAELEIKRQKGGYYPSIALVGSASGQDTKGSFYGGGQKQQNSELALKLSMPVFEGGLTNSLVRESAARLEKTMLEREQEERKTERAARAAYQSMETSASMLDALRKAVVAQDSALQTRLEGYKAGVATVVVVADAYRLYFSARRDYLQARYDYLVNRLKLKQAVGSLSRSDLSDLNDLMN